MIRLLRYSQYSAAEHDNDWADHTKHYQKLSFEKIAKERDWTGQCVGEIGSKHAFQNLLDFKGAWHAVIEPYNGAAGAGPEQVSKFLPYPVVLYRCLVGPDSAVIPDATFDVTFSISVFEHIGQVETNYDVKPVSVLPPEQEQPRDEFCRELFRITKPGGITIHTIDHAARNLTFADNLRKAGFVPVSDEAPSVEECLSDKDAVRQRVQWTQRDKPMPKELAPFNSAILLTFQKPVSG